MFTVEKKIYRAESVREGEACTFFLKIERESRPGLEEERLTCTACRFWYSQLSTTVSGCHQGCYCNIIYGIASTAT